MVFSTKIGLIIVYLLISQDAVHFARWNDVSTTLCGLPEAQNLEFCFFTNLSRWKWVLLLNHKQCKWQSAAALTARSPKRNPTFATCWLEWASVPLGFYAGTSKSVACKCAGFILLPSDWSHYVTDFLGFQRVLTCALRPQISSWPRQYQLIPDG